MNRQLFIVLLSALFIRLIYFFSMLFINPPGFIEYDSGFFLHLAKNITNNFSFSVQEQPPFIPDPYHTPLYPLFLAGIIAAGGGIYSIVIIQILLSVFSCGLAWLICRNIGSETSPAIIAASIMALDIPSIVFANSVMTETLFVFLFMVSLYFYFEYFSGMRKLHPIILSAIFLGLAILTRPIALYLPVIFFSGFLIGRSCEKRASIIQLMRAGKMALIFSGVVFLTILPWYARNYYSFGHVFFSLIGKVNLCNFHASAIKAGTTHRNFYEAREEFWSELANRYGTENMKRNIAGYTDYIAGESVKIISEHPFLFIKYHLTGVAHLLFKPVRGDIDRQLGVITQFKSITPVDSPFDTVIFKRLFSESGIFTSALAIIQWMLMIAVYLGLLKGWMVLYRDKQWFLLIFLSGILLYFINITLPPLTYARFRVPLIPVIALMSAIGINPSFKKLRNYLS